MHRLARQAAQVTVIQSAPPAEPGRTDPPSGRKGKMGMGKWKKGG